jgi:pilus assembly protein CpaF
MNPLAAVAVAGADTRHPTYQRLKGRVHQELLNRLNLERLTRTKREDAEPEIRQIIMRLLERESETTPLSLFERETLMSDVLDELFGLGPLEGLLKDPSISDILVNAALQPLVRGMTGIGAGDSDCREWVHGFSAPNLQFSAGS